jgi:hypothetical protein
MCDSVSATADSMFFEVFLEVLFGLFERSCSSGAVFLGTFCGGRE